MTSDPYIRKTIQETENLCEYFNDKEYTASEFSDAILKFIPIGSRLYVDKDYGDYYDTETIMVRYSRTESDEEYNTRIAEYERKKYKEENKSRIDAEKKKAKELRQLAKLKAKYENE